LNNGSLNYGLVSRALFVVALVGTLSHLLLDFTNSYGVHPFWPFDGRWYYGDAVFIVEPWLWLVAIPALFWNRPTRVGKVLLPLFYLLILAAVWLLGQVARDVAVVLLVFAAGWPLVQRALTGVQRTASGMAAWGLVTALFFAASSRAESTVRAAASTVSAGAADVGVSQVLDVVLNPGPGDWGCWSALVMSRDGERYRVTSAFVAPFGAVRSLDTCTARYQGGRIGSDVLAPLVERADPVFVSTANVSWRSSWSAPLAELPRMARERCEADAALYFMRTPVWQRVTPAQLLLSDARFGIGGSGFSDVVVPTSGDCSFSNGWIPGWVPPRADLLDAS
jgi:inner membrane protein